MSSEKFGHEPPLLGDRPLSLPTSHATHSSLAAPPVIATPTTLATGFKAMPVEHEGVERHLGSEILSIEKTPPVLLTAELAADAIDPEDPVKSVEKRGTWLRVLRSPFYFAARALDLFSLLLLIAIVAALPLLQFISLGYLLVAGARLADRRPWREALPGLRQAGKIGVFALLMALLSLPVMLVADLAHSAQLLEPDTPLSARWRIGAFILTAAWLVHSGWAAMRGGRWWHFVWPAPLKFVKQIWRPSTWNRAADELYDLVEGLQLPKLWWIGFRATAGALLWLIIPVSLMIIGQRGNVPIAPLFGLVGSLIMAWVMFYLPYFQLIFAQTGSMKSFLAIKQVRTSYAYAPWAHAISLVLLSVLAIPLYLLRIEATPSELTWLPSLFFAMLMLPTKLVLGWTIGYSAGRQSSQLNKRPWWSRLPANVAGFVGVAVYVGALFVAQLVAAQGAYVMYFQHAFLVPNPLLFGY